jgi:long-chain fatty acid transport protein
MMPGAALDSAFSAPSGTFSNVTFDGHSAIQFWKMAPTIAWNVNDKLSLGFSLNLDYQSITIKQRFRNIPFFNNPANPAAGVTQQTINLDLGRPTSQLGYGATVGAIYDISDMITVGVSYSSKQSFGEGEFRVGTGDVSGFNGATGKAGVYKLDLQYPQQAAFGISVKPIDPLLVAVDVKWINWSGTHDKVDLSGPSGSFFATRNPTGSSNSTELEFGWDDQTVYALGIQYAANESLNVRAGYNYAKAPIDEADVFNNLVFPALVEQHVSIGADYMLGDHWGLGATYMKALKNDITGEGDVSAGLQQATPFSADSGAVSSLEENTVGVQLTYKF